MTSFLWRKLWSDVQSRSHSLLFGKERDASILPQAKQRSSKRTPHFGWEMVRRQKTLSPRTVCLGEEISTSRPAKGTRVELLGETLKFIQCALFESGQCSTLLTLRAMQISNCRKIDKLRCTY